MYDFWSYAYKQGWATKDQLHEATELGDLTPEQYKQITGEDYVVA